MEIGRLPWLFAILTAAWFGWLANRVGRNWTLWAVGGAAFGLVTSTIIFGVGHAVSIPFSEHDLVVARVKWTLATAAVILVLGWALTSSLHRHHLAIWRKIRGDAVREPTAGKDVAAASPPTANQPVRRSAT